MEKIVLPGERVTTVTLDGSECAVKFSRPFRAFSVRNDGNTDVYIALESGKSAGDDGVISVSPGASDTYFHGRQLDTCYLFGNTGGKVQIKAQDTDSNSFHKKGKGGDVPGGNLDPIKYALMAADYDVGDDPSTWADTVRAKYQDYDYRLDYSGLIFQYNDRKVIRSTDVLAYCAYCWGSPNWFTPVLISAYPEGVEYTIDGVFAPPMTLPNSGSFEYDGQTIYYNVNSEHSYASAKDSSPYNRRYLGVLEKGTEERNIAIAKRLYDEIRIMGYSLS